MMSFCWNYITTQSKEMMQAAVTQFCLPVPSGCVQMAHASPAAQPLQSAHLTHSSRSVACAGFLGQGSF